MKTKIHPLLILLACFFIACGDNNDDPEEQKIVLSDSETSTQAAFADEENTGDGFTFTAKSSWAANITDASLDNTRAGNNVAWLKLLYNGVEKYSGDAGTFKLVVAIEANYTGEERSARITISCEDQEIVIHVTQQAIKQNGALPTRLVAEIQKGHLENDNGIDSDRHVFTYNADNKIIKYEMTPVHNRKEVYTFTYNEGNQVVMEKKKYENDGITYKYDKWELTLNNSGYATRLGSVTSGIYILKYDDDGYLTERSTDGGKDILYYEWTNGNLSTIRTPDDYYNCGYEYNTVLNDKLNVDVNMIFTPILDNNDYFNIMAACGFIGKRSKNYTLTPFRNLASPVFEDEEYIYMSEDTFSIKYEWDKDGCLTRINHIIKSLEYKILKGTDERTLIGNTTDTSYYDIIYTYN